MSSLSSGDEKLEENDDNEERRLTKMELHLKLVEINTKSFAISRRNVCSECNILALAPQQFQSKTEI